MYSRHEIAGLLGYDYNPTYPDEANEKIDRLLAIEAERGLSAMADEAAAILREPRSEPEPVHPPWTDTSFLADLTRLSREHGLIIEGCGCCGSPWISEISPDSDGRYTTETHWRGQEMLKWEETKDERG